MRNNNTIPKNNLFITPKSLDEVMNFINAMPAKEQASAMTAVMFALNWAHDQAKLDRICDELGIDTPAV